ncbi:hypothetical protein CY35_12G072100 [Sphagnum magellanicum]|nr:hypothetical protein CY35_12G072100 [Sphagnum magellanicum]
MEGCVVASRSSTGIGAVADAFSQYHHSGHHQQRYHHHQLSSSFSHASAAAGHASSSLSPQLSSFSSVHSVDEMKHLLMCATMELESARTVATLQDQVHRAWVQQMEELLQIARYERDEARKECLHLQQCLSHSPSLNESSLSESLPNTGLAGVVESTADTHHYQQQQQLEELHQHLELHQSHLSSPHASSLVHHEQNIVEHSHDSVQVLQHLDFPSLDLQYSLHTLPQIHSPDEQCFLSELESIEQVIAMSDFQHQVGHQQHHGLLQQCSDEQADHKSEQQPFPQMQQQSKRQKIQSEEQAPVHQQTTHDPQDNVFATVSVSQQHATWQSVSVGGASFSPQHMCSSSPHSSSISLPTTCLHSGSAVASLLSPLELCDMSKPSSMHPGSRLVHLPEPPEADPQVMLNSLPEKGKLLQAVMQAGPLLQTLLLAGPLPKWRYPPPVLDTINIPQVPISSSTSCDSRTVITNMDPMAVRHLNSHSVVHLLGPTCTQDDISRHPSPLSSTSTAPCAADLASQGIMHMNSIMGDVNTDERMLHQPL